MKRFDRDDEGGDNRLPSERLQAFTKALWNALVPEDGECASVRRGVGWGGWHDVATSQAAGGKQ